MPVYRSRQELKRALFKSFPRAWRVGLRGLCTDTHTTAGSSGKDRGLGDYLPSLISHTHTQLLMPGIFIPSAYFNFIRLKAIIIRKKQCNNVL